MSKTTEKITMTLTKEVLDRYDQLGDALNLSRPKTLEALLDCYDDFYGDPKGAKTIKLISYFDSQFLPKIGPYPTEFCGKAVYDPPSCTTSNLSAVQLQELLEAVQKKPFTVDPGTYSAQHKLILYYNFNKKNYVVQEHMAASQTIYVRDYDSEYPTQRSRHLFTLKRVHSIDNFNDVVRYFGQYSSMDELESINKCIQNTTITDGSLLEELF